MFSKESFVKFSSIIIYFLPLSILTGPFLPDLSISIISIFFLIYLIKNKEYKYINNLFFKIFTLFCLYLLINSLFSEFPGHTLKTSTTYFRFGLFSIATWFVLDNNQNFLIVK